MSQFNNTYWNNFYSNGKELPFEPSQFSIYALKFLQSLPKKDSQIHILDLGCGNGRDAYFFSSRGLKVTGIDPASQIETDKFKFIQRSVFDLELKGFDVYYIRFVIHTLLESDCDQLLENLSLLPSDALIMFETRSTTNITNEKKSETFFRSPIGDEHFRMLYSKDYMDSKLSERFTILKSSDSADVAVFKSENPFCLRYIIQPKR
jgi:tellurite methyltransferase